MQYLEVIDIIYRRMFYSPKKNIEAFIEAKNEEIKTLKQKILGTRVTYEEMEEAKARLHKLKAAHHSISQENHQELKDLLKSTHQAVTQLVQKKNRLVQELEERRKETNEMNGLLQELNQKKEKTQEYQREVTEVRAKLQERKEKKNQQILELEEEIDVRRKQIQMELSISEELSSAREELKGKTGKAKKMLSERCEENKKLREVIKQEMEAVGKLERNLETDELRIENLQLRISNEEKQIQNYQQKIESSQAFLQRVAEDRLTLIKESETSQNIEALIKMVTETSEGRDKEEKACEEIIKKTQQNIQEANLKREKLEQKVCEKRELLRDLKDKGAQFKNILNSIFHEDSNVLKILADKKVYDADESVSNKSTSISESANLKHDMMEMMATSDNFFMTNSH